MQPIRGLWIRFGGRRSPITIIGWSSAGQTESIERSEIGGLGSKSIQTTQMVPVAIVQVDGEKTLRYVELKYIEVTL